MFHSSVLATCTAVFNSVNSIFYKLTIISTCWVLLGNHTPDYMITMYLTLQSYPEGLKVLNISKVKS